MSDAFGASRFTYRSRQVEMVLDFGPATMFATGEGDLLGRDWRHDCLIAGLAARLQTQ